MDRALECPRYYALRYLAGSEPVAAGAAASTGTAFHAYRSAYIDHLRMAGLPADPPWVERWLDTHAQNDDLAELVRGDNFHIQPATIYGVELFVAVDSDFRAVEESDCSARPNRGPSAPSAAYHGTLDLLEVDGDTALVRDAKTGWSDAATRDYEAMHYAGLVFSLLSYVEYVEFQWDFRRTCPSIPLAFSRQFDFPAIRQRMASRRAEMLAQAERYAAVGLDGFDANPASGLCPYCPFTCPLKADLEKGVLLDAPLQDAAAARQLAWRIWIAEQYARRGRELLEPFLDQCPDGLLELGGGRVARLYGRVERKYPLDRVLDVLGYEAQPRDGIRPRWDVDLHSLLVSSTGLKSKAAAKKRDGLQGELDAVSTARPKFILSVGAMAKTGGGE